MSNAQFRKFCRVKGLKGRQKKRFRRALKARVKEKTSATLALPNQTLGGSNYAGQSDRAG